MKRTTTARPAAGRRSTSPGRTRGTGSTASTSRVRSTSAGGSARSRAQAPTRAVREPARPTDATFRRRRLVVLALVLVVAVGLVLGVRAALGALLEDPADGTDASAAGTGDPTPAVTAGPSDSPEATTPPSESDLANPVECRPDAVDLSVDLPSATLRGGATSQLRATLTNAGQVPCLLDVGAAQLVATISSGDDLVWSSAHCAGERTRRILLDVGASDVTTISWPGTRSAEGCPDDAKAAKPGTYRVVVTLLTTVPEGSAAAPATVAEVEETFRVG